MSAADAYTIDTKGLDKLVKALKAQLPIARVGILGSSNRKPGKKEKEKEKAAKTNAEVGALYEYNDNPDRAGGSFLRVPISDNLQKEMDQAGALDEEVLKEVVKQGTVIPWLKKVAILAENIVAGAFDSGGYGKWRPSNMAHKKNHQTLVETKQLRESITSEVKEAS